jgi:hypothetical protein
MGAEHPIMQENLPVERLVRKALRAEEHSAFLKVRSALRNVAFQRARLFALRCKSLLEF